MSIQSIGRYRLLRDLGQGAAAHVYLARDPASGRQVVVKLLAAVYTADPSFQEQFDRALKALAALDHPFLVPVQDFGREEDRYYVVQRYLPGGTLADRLDGRPMLLAEVVPILQRLSDALDTAHNAGVFHGDFNPAHVLFDINGRAFVTDLGLAPLLQGAGSPTQPGLPGLPGTPAAGWERFVTPAYMSPEQALGEGADSRSDVYALGVMLFEMLTGRQPYMAASAEGVVRQQVEEAVPQLSETDLARLVLPEEFNQVMARALSKQRDRRYPTAGILAEAMRSVFLMTPPPGPPEPPAPPDEPAPFTPSRPPLPPPPTLLAFEPMGREPAEIVRSEPPEAPPNRPSATLLGLGGIGLLVVIGLLALARWTNVGGWGLPPTPTPTPTATLTQIPTFTATASPTLTLTATPTPSSTPTATRTVTPTRTRTASPSATSTATPTETRTRAPTQPAFTRTPTATLAVAPLPLPVTVTVTP